MARRRHRPNERTPHPSDALAASSRRPKRATDKRRPAPSDPHDLLVGDSPEAAGPVSADAVGEPETIGSPAPLAGAPLGAPNPLAHAAPDAEVAAARLALGTEELDAPGEEELAELAVNGHEGGQDVGGAVAAEDGGELPAPSGGHTVAPARRISILQRLVTFLQGSWAELHRVQWPDRRQVIQATGVVIGFVIVAGVFLGLSDLASSHLMDWLLK